MDTEAESLVRSGQARRDYGDVTLCVTPQQSRELNDSWDPAVVIAGGGMCEGGRILHHLRHNLWRRGVQVLLTSFMAEGSLGRRLVEGAETVRIFREDVVVRADVRTVNGLSAHAGQGALLRWLAPAGKAASGLVQLVHGEDRQRQALSGLLSARLGCRTGLPQRFGQVEL
jgi:metallo-beta-lactamase family protein